MIKKLKLAIGSVYHVIGQSKPIGVSADLFFTFEMCGEMFIKGERFVVGVKHGMHPAEEGAVVIFDAYGVSEDRYYMKWVVWKTSSAQPRYQKSTT